MSSTTKHVAKKMAPPLLPTPTSGMHEGEMVVVCTTYTSSNEGDITYLCSSIDSILKWHVALDYKRARDRRHMSSIEEKMDKLLSMIKERNLQQRSTSRLIMENAIVSKMSGKLV